jgi:hypothetical protein
MYVYKPRNPLGSGESSEGSRGSWQGVLLGSCISELGSSGLVNKGYSSNLLREAHFTVTLAGTCRTETSLHVCAVSGETSLHKAFVRSCPQAALSVCLQPIVRDQMHMLRPVDPTESHPVATVYRKHSPD